MSRDVVVVTLALNYALPLAYLAVAALLRRYRRAHYRALAARLRHALATDDLAHVVPAAAASGECDVHWCPACGSLVRHERSFLVWAASRDRLAPLLRAFELLLRRLPDAPPSAPADSRETVRAGREAPPGAGRG